MKVLRIKWLGMENFKGAQNVRIDFKDETTLRGDNRTGKTTVTDAIYFCLYGKNSEDSAKFSIKPLDANNKTDKNKKVKVNLCLDINGTEEVFSRGVVEKWTKPHGEVEKVYEGDVTKFEINGVAKQKKEYDAEVSNVISAGLFKILSSPMEFHRLKWDLKRKALIRIVGEIDETKVLDSIVTIPNKGDYIGLINSLNGGTLDKYKLELAAKIKPLKEKLKELPIQIGEKQRDISKIELLDWNDLEAQIKTKKERIEAIDGILQNESKKHEEKAKNQTLITKQIGEKRIELQNIENDAKTEANAGLNKRKERHLFLTTKLNNLVAARLEVKKLIGTIQDKLSTLNGEKKVLLEEYHKLNSSIFELDKSKTICPTCEREIEDIDEKSKEWEGNFNADKAEKIAANKKLGIAKRDKIKEFEATEDTNEEILKTNQTHQDEIETELKTIDLKEVKVDFSMNKTWNDCYNGIETLNKSLAFVPDPGNDELKTEKVTAQSSIEFLQTNLKGKTDITTAETRIQELEVSQLKLAQEEADLEKQQSAIETFERAKMETLENKVNGLFQTVTFKMFEEQKNGGKKDDCICLINGVPYSDANTASKINAGVDICNILQQFNNISVPIIVDNRESVTELLPTKGQIINLFKDKNFKTLTVE